jgi:hypothetical protein
MNQGLFYDSLESTLNCGPTYDALGKFSSFYGMDHDFDGSLETASVSYGYGNNNMMFEYPACPIGPMRGRDCGVVDESQWCYMEPLAYDYDAAFLAQRSHASRPYSSYYSYCDPMTMPMNSCPGCVSGDCSPKRRYMNYSRSMNRDCAHQFSDAMSHLESSSLGMFDVDTQERKPSLHESDPTQRISDDENFFLEEIGKPFEHRSLSDKEKMDDDSFLDKDPLSLKKLIKKRQPKSTWTKMTKEIFNKMVEFERTHPSIKQCDLEKVFNVNRSTYWRWKRNFGIGKINSQSC